VETDDPHIAKDTWRVSSTEKKKSRQGTAPDLFVKKKKRVTNSEGKIQRRLKGRGVEKAKYRTTGKETTRLGGDWKAWEEERLRRDGKTPLTRKKAQKRDESKTKEGNGCLEKKRGDKTN